jgi:hypothetical protein
LLQDQEHLYQILSRVFDLELCIVTWSILYEYDLRLSAMVMKGFYLLGYKAVYPVKSQLEENIASISMMEG